MNPTRPSVPPPSQSNWLFILGTIAAWAASIVLVLPPADPEVDAARRAGQITGAVLAPLLLAAVVYGLLRLIRRKRPPFRFSRVAFWTLGIVVVLTVLNRIGAAGMGEVETRVTDEERSGLQIRTDSIVHPVMGFALPSPGSAYTVDADLQQRLTTDLEAHPGVVGWVLRRTDGQGTLVIQVTKLSPLRERQFRQFTTGLRSGALKSAGTVERDTIQWDGGVGDYELSIRYQTGVMGYLRCASHTRSDGGGLIVCLTTGSAGPDELAFVREGLTLQ